MRSTRHPEEPRRGDEGSEILRFAQDDVKGRRAEVRQADLKKKQFEALDKALQKEGRKPRDFFWVAIHETMWVFGPIRSELRREGAADFLMGLFDADDVKVGRDRAAFLHRNRASETALHISLQRDLPQEGDLYYLGLAQVLKEDRHRHIRILAVGGDREAAGRISRYFKQEFPLLAQRFDVRAVEARALKTTAAVQQAVNEVYQSVKGDRVIVSSPEWELLDSVLAPVGWKIQDDLGNNHPGVQAHRIRRELDLVQGLLSSEKIKKLEERRRQIIRARDLLEGEDLLLVEQIFDQVLAAQAIRWSA